MVRTCGVQDTSAEISALCRLPPSILYNRAFTSSMCLAPQGIFGAGWCFGPSSIRYDLSADNLVDCCTSSQDARHFHHTTATVRSVATESCKALFACRFIVWCTQRWCDLTVHLQLCSSEMKLRHSERFLLIPKEKCIRRQGSLLHIAFFTRAQSYPFSEMGWEDSPTFNHSL